MRVERRHPANLGDGALGVAVVIDVLRATSTAAVLFGRGVEAVDVAATPDDLGGLPPAARRLVFSELAVPAGHGERVDNSPSLASTIVLDGRAVALVTTNGTRALVAAAARADRVLAASFLNASATAAAIARLAPPLVTLVPAGNVSPAAQHAEDERCADAIAALLDGKRPDFAALAASARADARVQRRLAAEPALAADVSLCLSPDGVPSALEFRAVGLNTGVLTRCSASC